MRDWERKKFEVSEQGWLQSQGGEEVRWAGEPGESSGETGQGAPDQGDPAGLRGSPPAHWVKWGWVRRASEGRLGLAPFPPSPLLPFPDS